MTSGRKKDNRPRRPGSPRNPFAGRRRSGAGAHSEKKYGKKDRRKLKRELDEDAADGDSPAED